MSTRDPFRWCQVCEQRTWAVISLRLGGLRRCLPCWMGLSVLSPERPAQATTAEKSVMGVSTVSASPCMTDGVGR